jgi:hypothetical protein
MGITRQQNIGPQSSPTLIALRNTLSLHQFPIKLYMQVMFLKDLEALMALHMEDVPMTLNYLVFREPCFLQTSIDVASVQEILLVLDLVTNLIQSLIAINRLTLFVSQISISIVIPELLWVVIE